MYIKIVKKQKCIFLKLVRDFKNFWDFLTELSFVSSTYNTAAGKIHIENFVGGKLFILR